MNNDVDKDKDKNKKIGSYILIFIGIILIILIIINIIRNNDFFFTNNNFKYIISVPVTLIILGIYFLNN
jgi:uncharacterized integral membrane protein